MPTKISKQDLDKVLRDTAATLSKLASERDALAARNAELESEKECSKLAQKMHDKGLNTDVPVSALTENLQKQASAGKLGEITRAVDMIGPNMSLGSTGETGTAGEGMSSFESYILGH